MDLHENSNVLRRTLGAIPNRLGDYARYFWNSDQPQVLNPNNFRSMEQAHPLSALSLFHVPLNFLIGSFGIFVFLFSAHRLRLSLLFPYLALLCVGLLFLRATPFIALGGIPLITRQMQVSENSSIYWEHFTNYGSLIIFVFFLALWSVYVSGFRSKIQDHTGIFLPYYSKSFDGRQVGPTLGWGMGKRFQSQLPEWIIRTHPQSKMINSYNIGSFLIWKWWPYKKVFLDSKITAYSDRFRNILFNLSNNKHEYFLREGLHYAIYERNSNWVETYYHPSSDWRLLKQDGSLVLYGRKPPVFR